MVEKIRKRNRICLTIVGILLAIVLLVGFSYAYYSANVKENNKSQTVIKTNELGLIYTGVSEISAPSMIPGDSFKKTFTVENISDVAVDFNIYMENVTNEFNGDLVYTIKDEKGVVVDENVMPKTKEGKTYLKTTINIDAKELRKYTMEIEYKYLEDVDQSENQGAAFSGTVGIDTEKNVTEEGLYIVSVDPNGGVYEESVEVKKYTMSSGETVELKVPTRENHTFKGWTVQEEVVENNTLTVGSSNVTVIAKWELNGDIVAKINNDFYTTIQSAFDAAKTDDTIELLKDTTEKSTNSKTVKLDLGKHKVTGSITNSGILTIINGTIENKNGSAIVNSGTLILGINDEEVSQDSVAIIGTEIGIEQKGTFNFYDGYIEGKTGVTGKYNDIPENYYVFVDHNNEKDCQKIYLVDEPSRAVVKTIGKVEAYYHNVQDGINTTVLTNETLYAIRDFEAAYTLTVEEGYSATIDIKGYNVTTGYTITNNGILNILDSAEEKGILKPSVTITNNGILNINDISIMQTTVANVVNNYGELNISNSTITGLAGYAVSNKTNGTINMDENTYLKANGYAFHNESTTETIISGGNYQGINNVGLLTLNGGDYTSGNNAYAIYNDTNSNLKIDNANITTTKSGIYNKATMTLNGGKVNAPTGVVNEGTCVINDFVITSTSRGISNTKTITINNVNINSSDVGVYNTSSLTIKGGEIVGTNKGVYHYTGTTTINDGNISSTSGIGLNYERGETIVNGGKITGKTYGAYGSNYYYCGWSCTHTAGAIKIYGGEITGLTSHGLYVSGYTNSSALITDGKITGKTYGVYTDGPLTLGINNEKIDTTLELIGENYGLYINDGITNFYDGILKGKTSGYYGTITAIPDATLISQGTEQIDGNEYLTNYLILQDNFVKLGDVEYNSLQKAINAIESEGTIMLIDSPNIQKVSVNIPKEKKVIFDLNGNIYLTNQTITNNGTLIVKDSSEEKTGTITSESTPNLIVNSGTMTIESGNITKTNATNSLISTTSNLTLNGGNITTPGKGISGSGTVKIEDVNITTTAECLNLTGTTTINGGTYNSETSSAILGGTATVNDGTFKSSGNTLVSTGTVNVKGGTFTSSNGYGLYTQRNILNVYGGDIKGVVGIYNDYYLSTTWYDYYGSTVNIYGGNIEGTNHGVQNDNSYLNIYGGNIKGGTHGIYFNGKTLVIGTNDSTLDIENPSAMGSEYGLYIVSGDVSYYDGIFKGQNGGYYGTISAMPDSAIINGSTETIDGIEYKTNYLVTQENFVKIGEVEYNSLNKAIAAIETEGTMVLIASPSVQKATVTIPSEKNITFDLNGNTYLTTQTIINNGTLTIIDSSEDESGLITSASNLNLIENTGTMILESGNLSKTTSSGVPLSTKGNLTVNGGNITTPGIGISGSGTVKITDVNITTDGLCINLTGTTTIDGGTFTSTTVAATAGGTTTVNEGTFTSTGNAFVSTGTVNIKGGTFTSSDGYGLYTQRDILNVYDGDIKGVVGVYNEFFVTSSWYTYYGSTVNIYGGNIEGTNNGVQNDNSYLNIYGGNIKGGNYGVYFAGRTLVIGTEDETLNQANPEIRGELYGLYVNSVNNPTVNYYDGIFKGQTSGYYGDFNNIAKDSQISTNNEVIDEKEYITNYLEIHENIITNTTTDVSYNNINTAFKEANENDILKLTGNVTTYYEISNTNKNNITLDLNSYRITAVKPITNGGNLTIIDSSAEKKGKIDNIFAINIITNTGTLNIEDILLENRKSENYVITNNGTLALNNSAINCINGINNFGDSDLKNTNIQASTTAISNSGTLVVNGGEIVGGSYALYSSSNTTENIENTTLSSSNNAIYKTSTSNMIVKNTSVLGNVTNTGSGNLSLKVENIEGNFVNTGNVTLKLNNIDISKTIQNSNGTINYSDGRFTGEVVNSGTMNLDNITNNYQHLNNNASTLFNNSGTLNIKNSNLSLRKETTFNQSVIGINNTGKLDIKNIDLTVSDISTINSHFAIKNMSSGNVTIDGGNIKVSGGNTVYGVYSDTANNNTTILSGNIETNSINAYGVYVNNGIVTIGEYDGSGTEDVEVSTTSPQLLAVGTNTGIGVKKVNGYFKYYDGKIIGSTNAKPDTTTEVEYNYEANFYNEPDTGYEYCILEYMLASTGVAKINSTSYNSLQDAIDNANENDTIKLLKNINENVTVNKNVKINLNKKLLKGQVTNYNELTLINGTVKNDEVPPIINNGTLILGLNDEEVLAEDIIVLGNETGIKQNGTLKMYDGYIMAVDSIEGNAESIVLGYDIITKQINGYEKTYLTVIDKENLIIEFDYTGSEQSYIIPVTGTYKLETWGAQGGSQTGVAEGNGYASTIKGGYGSYSTGEINLEKGEKLYINVGGQGGNVTSRLNGGSGGYNGGGAGGDAYTDYFVGSAGGGGATHIATSSGLLKNLESNRNSILIVSGGGGGASWRGDKSGHAGGIESATIKDESKIVLGANQTTGYAFGQGQNGKKGFDGIGDCEGTGGGGGGYYGGYAFQHNNTGTNMTINGSGGSGYIGNALLSNKYMYCYDCVTSDEESTKTYVTNNVSDLAIADYAKKGNGYVKITFVEE